MNLTQLLERGKVDAINALDSADRIVFVNVQVIQAPDEIRTARHWIRRLGLPARSVRRWVARGTLPSVRCGRERLVRLSDLLAVIEREGLAATGPATGEPLKPAPAAESYERLVQRARQRTSRGSR